MKKIITICFLLFVLAIPLEEQYIDVGEMNFKRNADNRISFVIHKAESEGKEPQRIFVEMNVQKQDKKIWVELNKDDWKEFRELVEKADSIYEKVK